MLAWKAFLANIGKLFLALFKVFDSILICCFIGCKYYFYLPRDHSCGRLRFLVLTLGASQVRETLFEEEAFHGFGRGSVAVRATHTAETQGQ